MAAWRQNCTRETSHRATLTHNGELQSHLDCKTIHGFRVEPGVHGILVFLFSGQVRYVESLVIAHQSLEEGVKLGNYYFPANNVLPLSCPGDSLHCGFLALPLAHSSSLSLCLSLCRSLSLALALSRFFVGQFLLV